jgi:hypothetical protein
MSPSRAQTLAASRQNPMPEERCQQLMEKQAQMFGVRAAEASRSEIESLAESVPEAIIPPVAPIPAVVTQLMMIGMPYEAVQQCTISRRPSSAATALDQLGPFND